jgi:translation initiation factor IF-2
MAKIRAYKLAEELGIEKTEFVEKARALGIDLKAATSALSDEDVELVRVKLGGAVASKPRAAMDEKRVDRGGGAAVIRRRRRAKPEPEPEVAEPVAAAESAAPAPVEEDIAAAAGAEAQPVAEDAVDPFVAAESVAEQAKKPAAEAPAKPREAVRPGAEQPATPADKKGKQRKRVREVVNLKEQEQFGRQITSRGGARRPVTFAPSRTVVNPRRKRRDAAASPSAPVKPAADQKKIVRVDGEIAVGELAKVVGLKAPVVQGKLMAQGIMVSVNQHIGVEVCRQIATELGFEVVDAGFKEEEFIAAPEVTSETEVENVVPRAPVITVMGHVDHGKTSILDALRKTKVADGEAGGITQHIGAYQVQAGGHALTFIDTPGHAAFTHMRARGAQVTDLVVLVVAANDSVMPQTVEAIEHCRAAGCPIVVAVNKCDLPDADSAKVRRKLMEYDLLPEEFGGDMICVDVSAKTGEGLDKLTEMLALQAEVLELRADPERAAHGVVLEAQLDKGRGPLATVLVQTGTLRSGDTIVAGTEWGRVRLMEDSEGNRIKEAGPSVPVRVLGLSGVPAVGSFLDGVGNERAAKAVIEHRSEKERTKPGPVRPRLSLEELLAQADAAEVRELKVVLKADVSGTLEAVGDALVKLSTDAVTLKLLSSGVGAVNENDVMLASASDAIVVGFNVRPDTAALRAADQQGVEIRNYTIIMQLLDDVRGAMAGLLPPTIRENVIGHAEVKETFVIPKVGTIAGSQVSDGRIKRNAHCRLVRDGVQVYQGTIGSLRRFKDDVAEVGNGMECGIGVQSFNDVKVGDVIEAFDLEEEAPTL